MSTTSRPDHPPPGQAAAARLGPPSAPPAPSPADRRSIWAVSGQCRRPPGLCLGCVWAMLPVTWAVSGLCLGYVACHLGCVWAQCISPGLSLSWLTVYRRAEDLAIYIRV